MTRQNPVISGPITKGYIATLLPDNPVILEAGAHIGRDTIKMAKRWPKAQIYAFEPVPELFVQLVQNTREYPTIHPQQIALGSENKIADFFVSSGRSTAASSLFEPTGYAQEHPDTQFQRIQVTTQTLDSWVHEHNIPKIDFMWLDMQGSELSMLKAATQILKTVRVIQTEVNLTERYSNCPLYQEVRAWLESQGFTLTHEHIFKPTWGNALFVRK